MKRFFRGGLISLFFLLFLFGGFTIHTVIQTQTNGRLINYVGIVRGASQRLIKLELSGRPDDELIEYLDGILLELQGGEARYGLPSLKDQAYQRDLAKLELMWSQIRTEISAYRSGSVDSARLLSLSEDFFEQANHTVFSADAYSARQMRFLLTGCLVMVGIMSLTWVFIFWANSQNLLKLEVRNEQLNDLTRRDALTGVYLIGAFKEKAQQLLDSRPEKFALVYTDFSDFKYINDVFGYDYGDLLLAQYGKILQKELREHELCGRVSADNFVLLLHYKDKSEIAARQAAADLEILRFMHTAHDGQLLPTNCGICCVEDVIEALKIDGLLDRANFARKTVKTGDRQNYAYYDESIRSHLWEEKNIENRMLTALENREFTVYYQPKVDLSTGKIGCAEALVRWQSQAGTVIPPDRFIPVFERKYMIDRLDQYVYEEVCRWLHSLLDSGRQALPVSVNVSRLQFYDQNFVDRYVSIRDQYDIPPELLEIEFTESIAFDNSALLLQTVSRLKKAGFSCSIDDFGKGYSSLGLLKNLPIDVLKIDSFFFDEGPDRSRDMALVESIVTLVKKFDIRTVAEGIESMEQVEYLKRIGCDYVQGYVFYRPMPQQDYETLLTEAG